MGNVLVNKGFEILHVDNPLAFSVVDVIVVMVGISVLLIATNRIKQRIYKETCK